MPATVNGITTLLPWDGTLTYDAVHAQAHLSFNEDSLLFYLRHLCFYHVPVINPVV